MGQLRHTVTQAVVGMALMGAMGCSPNVVVTSTGDEKGSAGNGRSGSGAGSDIALPPSAGTGNGGTTGATSPPATAAPSTNSNCGLRRINLQRQPADLLLILDRSRSMNQAVGGRGGSTTPVTGDKWTEVVSALDPVIMRTEAQVSWGLKLYPLGDSCGVPEGATVPVAGSNYDEVMNAIRSNNPSQGSAGSTPTRVAVEKAAAILKASTSPNTKYLVLATDGLPNCRGGGSRTDDDEAGAIQAVANASTEGMSTFVVGVATEGSEAHDTLNQMALKGGQPRNGATKYFPVASRDELVSALETITGQVASCTFPLGEAPPVPDNVAVEIDGARIPRDSGQTQGWNYGANNRSVVLYGAICEGLKTGAVRDVQILFGCPGMTIN